MFTVFFVSESVFGDTAIHASCEKFLEMFGILENIHNITQIIKNNLRDMLFVYEMWYFIKQTDILPWSHLL